MEVVIMNEIKTSSFGVGIVCPFSVTVGTNCPQGGDSGHGGRTVLKFQQEGGADLRVSIDGGSLNPATTIEIVLGGDAECEEFIELLGQAAAKLKCQREANESFTGSKQIP
jgi:hypothetical protein